MNQRIVRKGSESICGRLRAVILNQQVFIIATAVLCLATDATSAAVPPPTPAVSTELIYPSATKSERLAAMDAFWLEWKKIYLHEGCDGAYVNTSGDGKPTWGGSAPQTLTVSEAHGYGMLALVRMADRDNDAQRLFGLMYAYFKNHPAASSPGLMAWNQTTDCKDADDGGDMSATDGDLDIALALQLADRCWGGYGTAATEVRQAILDHEVTADGMMQLGDWAADDEYANASRSSDFMPGSFSAFAKAGATDAPRWLAIRERGYSVWGEISEKYAHKTGLVPDFITGLPDAPHPTKPFFLEGESDGQFSWNALRYPWRLGLDLIETGEPRARERLSRINKWIQKKTHGDPMAIATTYRLDGTVPNDQETESAAFIAMFAVSAMAGSEDPATDQRWMDDLWAALIQIPIENEDYYGATLKLLAMMTLCEL